jgi:hypothetical protein
LLVVVDICLSWIDSNLSFLISNLGLNGKSNSTSLSNLSGKSGDLLGLFASMGFDVSSSGNHFSEFGVPAINLCLVSGGSNLLVEFDGSGVDVGNVFTHVHLLLNGDHKFGVGSLSNELGLGDSEAVSDLSDVVLIFVNESPGILVVLMGLFNEWSLSFVLEPSGVNEWFIGFSLSLISQLVELFVSGVEVFLSGDDLIVDSFLGFNQAGNNGVGVVLGGGNLIGKCGECLRVLVGFLQSGCLLVSGSLFCLELHDFSFNSNDLGISGSLGLISVSTHGLALIELQLRLKFGLLSTCIGSSLLGGVEECLGGVSSLFLETSFSLISKEHGFISDGTDVLINSLSEVCRHLFGICLLTATISSEAMCLDNRVQSVVHGCCEHVSILLSSEQECINLFSGGGFGQLLLQSGSDLSNGYSGLGTSSRELGSGLGISEGRTLLTSDFVGVFLGFWDSLSEAWLLTSLVNDLSELLVKCSFGFNWEWVGTVKEFLDCSIWVGFAELGIELGLEVSCHELSILSGVVESDLSSTGSQCSGDSISSVGEIISSGQWCDGLSQSGFDLGGLGVSGRSGLLESGFKLFLSLGISGGFVEGVLDLGHWHFSLHDVLTDEGVELGSHDDFWVIGTCCDSRFCYCGESVGSLIFGLSLKKLSSEELSHLLVFWDELENVSHGLICSGLG